MSDSTCDRTARIAQRVCSIGYEQLDAATLLVVKRLIMDGIAVAIAGTAQPAPRLIADYARDQGAKALSTAWGFGFDTSPALAAYVNAASMHVLDFEPMSSPPTHAVSPTVPAAFALGQALGAHGRDIVAACAKGFELQGRVLLASGHARGALPFHTPGVVGVMGSTAAASHLLGLNANQLAHAFGISTSRCGGLAANTGSMVKCTHCGNAAAAGVEAATMAQRGFTAHPDIFSAPKGYVATFFPLHFDDDALLGYGAPFRCVDPGMAIKFYPSKYPTHFVIAAALALRRRIGDPLRIRALRIMAPDIEDADRPQPRSGLEGKFSFQYTGAIALLDGQVGIGAFTDERRFRADVTALLAKITVERDPAVSRDTRDMHVELHLTLEDGQVHVERCGGPPGAWGRAFDSTLHEAKLRDCLGVRLAPAQSDRVLEMLARLDQSSAAEVAELMAVLT